MDFVSFVVSSGFELLNSLDRWVFMFIVLVVLCLLVVFIVMGFVFLCVSRLLVV